MKTGLDRSDPNAYRKAYYQANKEKQLAYMKAYYQANKEKCVAATKAWIEANKERVKKCKAEYQKNNKALITERHKKWKARLKETNPEKYKAMRKADYVKYKEYYDKQNNIASKQRVQDMPDAYIRQIILWDMDKTIQIPQSMIEAKRLEILIKRRIKNEECNTTT